jgi:hypothetical protein
VDLWVIFWAVDEQSKPIRARIHCIKHVVVVMVVVPEQNIVLYFSQAEDILTVSL